MEPIITAGIFLIRKDGKLLVCHPTKHPANVWGIPKGRIDKGENLIEAAVRETLEETNMDVSNWKIMRHLSPVKYPKSNKILHGYVLFESENQIDFNSFDLKCNSKVEEEKGGFPEMDDFKWVTLEEAKSLIHASQTACLPKIEEYLNELHKQKINHGK